MQWQKVQLRKTAINLVILNYYLHLCFEKRGFRVASTKSSGSYLASKYFEYLLKYDDVRTSMRNYNGLTVTFDNS